MTIQRDFNESKTAPFLWCHRLVFIHQKTMIMDRKR